MNNCMIATALPYTKFYTKIYLRRISLTVNPVVLWLDTYGDNGNADK